ncbi:hypothetical protein BUE93_21380 [Chromobacterium amazonense]|uniref:Bro-N domain-containing protein n=1 Tax=Chromobacterium amazonense TaxID=1382803 RepID=A0A2S9WYX3_9NEIS|nr:antA/AntB antirepressor family protein [Chromobacterium amazonense]PRP68596.1 hypothetical protein BUE93_21380 [Chromobacterium amazonense]
MANYIAQGASRAAQNPLINTFQAVIGGEQVLACDARELHSFLQNRRQFADWMKQRIEQGGFTENLDYVSFSQKSEKPQPAANCSANAEKMSRQLRASPEVVKKSVGGRPTTEYVIAIDMAKHLGMMERNEQGKAIRAYFIEVEKQALHSTAAVRDVMTGARGDIPFVLNHFENEDGHSLTASLDELGVMWVCAGMLGDMLGLENTLALVQAHCRPEGVRMWMDQQVFVDEMNTHRLLARSGAAAADHVSDWLAREVLPALRQASFDRLAGLNPDDAQQVDRLSAPQYMKQARELLYGYLETAFGDVCRAPALPQPSAALVDGLLASLLTNNRWLLSFDRNLQMSLQPVSRAAELVAVDERSDLEQLMRNVPVELLPELINRCVARLGSAAARRG